MSKMGEKPEKSGELKDYGSESSMENHKGPYVRSNKFADGKNRAWHGFKKNSD